MNGKRCLMATPTCSIVNWNGVTWMHGAIQLLEHALPVCRSTCGMEMREQKSNSLRYLQRRFLCRNDTYDISFCISRVPGYSLNSEPVFVSRTFAGWLVGGSTADARCSAVSWQQSQILIWKKTLPNVPNSSAILFHRSGSWCWCWKWRARPFVRCQAPLACALVRAWPPRSRTVDDSPLTWFIEMIGSPRAQLPWQWDRDPIVCCGNAMSEIRRRWPSNENWVRSIDCCTRHDQ